MNRTLSQLLSRTAPRRPSDIDHLLDFVTKLMFDVPGATASTAYYRPPVDSELGRECKDAFRVLGLLEADEDFLAFVNQTPKTNNSPLGDFPYDFLSQLLSSSRSPIPSLPEVFDIGGKPVVLRHAPLYFANQIDVLLAIHQTVGNGIKSDGTVRVDLVLAYYSITPFTPTTEAHWKAVENNLREHRALYALGHDGHVSDLEHLLDPEDDKSILSVIRQIESEAQQALFARVMPKLLTPAQQTDLDSRPTVLLEWILSRPRNLALGQRIATALDWYGAEDGEECPSEVKVKLLLRALWLTITPDPHSYNDNELKAFIPPAVDYRRIRQSLIKDYQRTLALSPHAARLAMCVAKANVASEVWVEDVPDDLPYGTSSAWVNFKSGFILAEAIAPGSSRHLTFEQLLNLPAELLRVHADSPRQQALVAAAKVTPTLTWAVENGVLPVSRSGYSRGDIEKALHALEQHESEMKTAVQNLVLKPPSRFRFASDVEFDRAFGEYLETPRAAYKTLIKGLLAQYLPLWQGNIDCDEVTIYTLREPLHDTQLEHENKRNTDAVRGRAGFIIRMECPLLPGPPKYIEMFPGIGAVRLRDDIKNLLTGGEIKVERVGSSTRPGRGSFRKGTEVPFDWNAYRHAARPALDQTATLIIEQLGQPLPGVITAPPTQPPSASGQPAQVQSFAPNTLHSTRAEALASMIARELFFCDEQTLLEQTRKATREMDISRDFVEDISFWGKMFVPFWGSIDELSSGDPQRIESGSLGLFTDIVSFGVPVGKYIAGCTRWVVHAGQSGIRLALPHLSSLTKKLVISIFQELNPLAAVSAILKLGRFGLISLGSIALRHARLGIAQLRDGAVAARHMVSVDPAVWTPRQVGDQLFTVDGFANIPMRNVGTLDAPDYRLINADSNSVFGPRFREPVTVISNNNPLIKQYAVKPHLISGLKPDIRGVFFRPEYNQKFICNVDHKGRIAVYQIREQGYGYLEEIAEGTQNSFSVALVNRRNNLTLPVNLTSVKSGHWYSVRLQGGAPDKDSIIPPSVLTKWSEESENTLNRAMRAFERKHKLDPSVFRQFVHASDHLTPLGRKVLDRATHARTEVTYTDTESWRALSQTERNALTLSGFCAQRNLDPRLFGEYINLQGVYSAHGKVFAKNAKNESFNLLTYKHLNDWNNLRNSRDLKPLMTTFVEQHDLNPVQWSIYVKENGSLTRAGKNLLQLWPNTPSGPLIARKGSLLIDGPGSPKRPRTEDPEIAGQLPSTSIAPSYGHQINNNAAILQDPNNVELSLTSRLEGPVENIEIVADHNLFNSLPAPRRMKVRNAVTKSIQQWVTEEGRHHDRLDRTLQVAKLPYGPERGLSVVARVDIEPFEVIGPYTGKLHVNRHSLNEEIVAKGKEGATAVSTFLFETATQGATLSGHGNSNVLSLINATRVPNAVSQGIENVRSVRVGNYMIFLVASKKIPAGTELLMDYGKHYWKYIGQ